MRNLAKITSVGVFLALSALCAFCQAPAGQDAGPRGHWSGNVDLPNRQLGVEIDLDKPGSEWIGTIAIPAQNASAIPLDKIAFADGKWSFRIGGVPGDPVLTGTLAADGKSFNGDFAAVGGSFPFKLTRSGEAKIEAKKANPRLGESFVGNWEGALQVPGATLHLNMKLSNMPEGASAQITSVDQGNAQIPVNSVEQKGTRLVLKVNMIGGEYSGEINADGTDVTGNWTQSGNTMPLVFKKTK